MRAIVSVGSLLLASSGAVAAQVSGLGPEATTAIQGATAAGIALLWVRLGAVERKVRELTAAMGRRRRRYAR